MTWITIALLALLVLGVLAVGWGIAVHEAHEQHKQNYGGLDDEDV